MVDAHGRTPLHIAARQGRAQMVEALLQAGADAKAQDQVQTARPQMLQTDLGQAPHTGSTIFPVVLQE